MIRVPVADLRSREFAYASGCTEMHTPKLMGTASESGAGVFEVGYFGRTAYLAQSPQFYKQMAIAAGIDRVFEIGPMFRAEPSFTSRHATEFTGVDGGLGLGLGRLLMTLLGLDSIREATFLFRGPNRLTP